MIKKMILGVLWIGIVSSIFNLAIYADISIDLYLSSLQPLTQYYYEWVPQNVSDRNEFTHDFLECVSIGDEYYVVGLESIEKYNGWEEIKREISFLIGNTDIGIESFSELRKLPLIGYVSNYDGTYPNKLFRLKDDVIILEDVHCKYDENDVLTRITTNEQLIGYRVCEKMPESFLYTNCWYESQGSTYYIGENHIPVTKPKVIDNILYQFDKNGVCKGPYTGWAKSVGSKVYYKDGLKVTKNTTINGVRWRFDKNGICQGKYSGFVKSSKGRRYYNNGVMLRNQKFTLNGKKYVADSKGWVTEI